MTPRLVLRSVSKSFEGVRALVRVSLSVMAGEVHVIAGENGAGKSTLTRILSGVYADYSGDIELDGRSVRIQSPAAARGLGIHTIHQELSLVPSLSAVDNVYLKERGALFGGFSRRRARSRTERLLGLVGLDINPELPVERLSMSERQLLEIARALGEDARVLILDEPTSALSKPEADRLFASIQRFCADGTSVIYISHRMHEIYRIADRISVLRDGQLLLTEAVSNLPEPALVRAMLGDRLRAERKRPIRGTQLHPVRLSVRGLGCAGNPSLHGIDFQLQAGEVLGVAGVRGSGASRLLYALFGALGPVRGSLELSSVPYRPSSPGAALKRRLSLLPSDRRNGVLPELSGLTNATLSSLARYTRFGFVDSRAESAIATARVQALSLRETALSARAGALSGGNQQKLLLLRCLLSQPEVLLLDDPLRGVDVGAKADVIELISEMAADGLGLMFYSSELEDLLRVCGRVLVLSGGRLSQILEGSELTREHLLSAIMGDSS